MVFLPQIDCLLSPRNTSKRTRRKRDTFLKSILKKHKDNSSIFAGLNHFAENDMLLRMVYSYELVRNLSFELIHFHETNSTVEQISKLVTERLGYIARQISDVTIDRGVRQKSEDEMDRIIYLAINCHVFGRIIEVENADRLVKRLKQESRSCNKPEKSHGLHVTTAGG